MDTDDSSNTNYILLNKNDILHQIYLFLEKIKSWLLNLL